jgi:hypothetical protein
VKRCNGPQATMGLLNFKWAATSVRCPSSATRFLITGPRTLPVGGPVGKIRNPRLAVAGDCGSGSFVGLGVSENGEHRSLRGRVTPPQDPVRVAEHSRVRALSCVVPVLRVGRQLQAPSETKIFVPVER